MGRFDKVKDAPKYNDGGVWFEEGNYLVRVDKIKCQDNRKKIEQFFVETTILESDNPKRKPGSQASAMSQETWDTYYSWIKHTLSVMTPCDEDQIDNAGVEAAVSEDNPFQGTIVALQATNVKTKAGGEFTKITWREATPEQLKKYGAKAA